MTFLTQAEAGGKGGRRMCSGATGKDTLVKVPPGTLVFEVAEPTSGREEDEETQRATDPRTGTGAASGPALAVGSGAGPEAPRKARGPYGVCDTSTGQWKDPPRVLEPASSPPPSPPPLAEAAGRELSEPDVRQQVTDFWDSYLGPLR